MRPAVPAEIEIRIRFVSAAAQSTEHVLYGRSNRFGYFAAGESFRFSEAGEYRVDLTATHRADNGVTWKGNMTWGCVVETPATDLVTHGRRGFEGNPEIGQQWFFFDEAEFIGDHVMYPFHGGDVMWMEDLTGANLVAPADTPAITIDDRSGALADRIRSLWSGKPPPIGSPDLEQRIAAGEIPLLSASGDAFEPATQRGYAYAFAERPGARVRELVSEDSSGPRYWRFRDNYHWQLGNGIEGDRVNDFKFQFGGAVFRDPDRDFSFFGAYGSLFVLIPEHDETGGRIFPPFQGNGGGPSGGPLFRLKNRDIDLFFHPTALRPGTILHRGQRASFAGYSAPTLPSKVEIVVTSPSGRVRTIAGQANRIGYFYDPSQDFTVGESGVWKAKVRIVFDGRTSAGQVTEPFPFGDVLGSRSGEFYFYVVDSNSDDVAIAPKPQFVRPADGPITFTIQKPAGLTNAQLTYTATMPGFILEEGTKSSMSYTYDAQKLAKDFPNLDLHDADGFAGADTITISFLLSGMLDGKTKHYARQIVIQGEELQMPEQGPRPKRRAAR
jgi:hypothetical protein